MEENITEPNQEQLTKEEIVKKREGKFLESLKKPALWVIVFLILLLILGAYIRLQPMLIRSNTGKPGLWDIVTNDWTLGPDLDPWLFTRYAKTIVQTGSLPFMDYMRNVPLGFKTSGDTVLLPYMIAWTHYLINISGPHSINFSAALFPVLMFLLTIIAFFLFVREIFYKKDSEDQNLKANVIALISTLFMIIIPVFISRTVAGIPEKESAAFFFMFLSFYFYLKAWKSEKTTKYVILAILSGLSTACLGAIWGGVLYGFITIAFGTFMAFLLNKVNKREYLVYLIWILSAFLPLMLFSGRLTLSDVLVSLDTGFVSLILFIMTVHFLVWKTPLKNLRVLNHDKIPKNIISLILAIVLGLIVVSIMFGPSFIINKIDVINHALLTPTTGRWQTTVAENKQPYFKEWGGNFGPFVKNIPILFWLFFIGSALLFKDMLNCIKKKDAWILTGLYILFFFGLVFSRYSSAGTFNGENFISKLFYFGSALVLMVSLLYYYIKYHKEGNKGFEKINFEYLLLFALFILCLMTSRGAVRLIMVLAPVAVIFVGYLIISLISRFFEAKDEMWKIIIGVFLIVVIISSGFAGWTLYKESMNTVNAMVPYYYNQQWQEAMNWVRNDTPKDAVFASWWDYGYWLQSIGDRATVTDGGNAITFWNYYMGRLVLTGDNQQEALNFLWNHNASYFLIDSSDIGKYGAYSSIGSNEDFDRFSWISNYLLDEKQTQETRNQTIYIYSTGGGIPLDGDLIIQENGKDVLLPLNRAGIVAMVLPVSNLNETKNFEQPSIIVYYQNAQHKVDLRYLYIDGKINDFGSGIEATMFVYPRLTQSSTGSIGVNQIGAAMYISPLLMKSFMVNVYLLNDVFNKYPNFVLAHNESGIIIADLRRQGLPLPDIVYLQGVQGPIKIWSIKYTGQEKPNPAYLDRVASKYLNWSL